MNKLYTSYIDYFATGEGRTIFLHITYSNSKEEAIQKMEEKIGKYGDYFILGVKVIEDFDQTNPYVQELLTPKVIDFIQKKNANIDIYVEHHFNLS